MCLGGKYEELWHRDYLVKSYMRDSEYNVEACQRLQSTLMKLLDGDEELSLVRQQGCYYLLLAC